MHAILLAAGRGTRMRPLSDTRPKPMLPIAGRPIVAHVADAAIDAGATKLVLTVGYRDDVVRNWFGDAYRDIPIEYAVQETQNGTADAVDAAIDHVEGPFAVLNGDNVYDADALSELFANVPGVGVAVVDSPESYGVVSMEGDTVTGIEEKPANPASNTVNTGAYAFPASVRDFLDVPESERGERELTDVLQHLIDVADVQGITFETWADIGYPWELLEANERALGDLSGRVDGRVHADATLRGQVVVEPGAVIDAGVVIEGPVLVREGATIGPNAYVRGATVIGEGASVGHAVEVKNSLLLEGANVNHLSYVGDSIVGPDANLGAGTIVANLRHDDASILAGAERYETGRRKFGAIVGPGVKTGINTSLNPGVVLSSNAMIPPGSVITTDR